VEENISQTEKNDFELETAVLTIRSIVNRVEGQLVLDPKGDPSLDLIVISKVMKKLDEAVIRCQTEK